MSAITDVRCVLTQEALDAFCNTFHIPEEHTAKHMIRDPAPVVADFNAQDYATLVAHPSPFRKFPEAFLCLVGMSRHYTSDEDTYPRFVHKNGEDGCLILYLCYTFYGFVVFILTIRLFRTDMDLFAFIHAPDPTKVRVVERERDVDEPRMLDTTVGHIVLLLPIAPDRADSKLEASVERLLDEGKRKYVAVDAGGASHPPKKLREDHGTPSGNSVGAYVSTTPERKDEDHTDSVAEPNLRIIGALQRSSTHVMTTATTVTFMVDSTLVAKEKIIKPSLFAADSSSASGADPNTGVFSDLTGSNFLVGGIHAIIDPDTDLQKVFFFASIRRIEHDQLFFEFNVGGSRQMSVSAEVRMRAEYNVKERKILKYVVEKQDELVKARDGWIENLKAQILLKEAEVVEAIRLRAQTSNLEVVEKSLRDEVNSLKGRNVILKKERDALDVKVTDLEALVVGKERDLTDLNAKLTSVKSQNDSLVDHVHELEVSSAELQEKITVYDNCMEQLEKFQDDRMKVVNDKLVKLDSELAEMACHLEENFYPRAIEKRMLSGLAVDIDHGREGRSLADVAAYNPNAEVDFNTALQELRKVYFPYKDASTEDIMNVLRLECALADAPRMNDLQPDIEQLMVPIHRFEDQVVLGETSLSFALSVSHSRVEQIRENIVAQWSTLVGVWTPLLEPLSVTSLMGEASTSGVVPTDSVTTTALSTTFASANSIPPISIDDYEIVDVDGQEGAGANGRVVVDENVASFPNVDDVELNIPRSTSDVLNVGMPIYAGMIASVPYVSENGVSPLLDFIMVRVSYKRYSKIGVIHVSSSSSTIANISTSLIDFSFNSSTNTCLLRCAKLMDTILLSIESCQLLLRRMFHSLDLPPVVNQHVPEIFNTHLFRYP
nr:hypothetical protein [Tanacetum cinerariifolium]